MASTSSGMSSQSFPNAWPPEHTPPVGYLSRKALPIKRNDASPLTREDVQYDLLNYIFSDAQAVFTNQTPGKSTNKLTFRELYVNALYNSTKCSKVLKDKMIETPAFAIELAKISLLTNVGRINTTMAFFPEMKTALRTYHPVPSLQKTDGNAQDAPRIKNCLKAALLPSEFKTVPPSSPEEILDKIRAGQRPPTSVVNLVFVLSNHAAPLASVHFDGSFNFLDLFLPTNLSSADRARAFLWLLYHYLESRKQNPFDDDYSRKHPGKAPLIRKLSAAEMRKENVDTPEEIEWGNMMSGQRNAFLQKLVSSIEYEKRNSRNPPPPTYPPGIFDLAPPARSQRTTAPAPADHSYRRTRVHRVPHSESHAEETPFMYYVPNRDPAHAARHPIRLDTVPQYHPQTQAPPPSNLPREERTMLQHAWHMAMSSDPLVDSDEENPDEHVRLDYSRRLGVLSRLRGRPPTPDRAAVNVIAEPDARSSSHTARNPVA